MNEHAGAACALSVLIVGFFAVLLHDKAPTPPRPVTKPPGVARDSPKSSAPQPAPTPVAPRIETALIRAAPIPPAAVTVAAPKGPTPDPKVRLARVAGPSAPSVRRPEERPRPARPRGGFTVVEAGESLADVAARVYGAPGSAELLWKANRDQLAEVDSPLAKGTLLRTP